MLHIWPRVRLLSLLLFSRATGQFMVAIIWLRSRLRCGAGFFSLTSNYPINADSTPIKPEFCSTPQAPEGKHYAQIHLGMFAAVLRQSKDDLDDSKAWYTKGAVLVELGRYADAGRHFIKPWSGAAEFSPCTTGHFASVRLVARNPFGANERELISGDPLFAHRGCTACRLHIWR